TTLTTVAKWLHVALPEKAKPKAPLDLFLTEHVRNAMAEIVIPPNSYATEKMIVDLNFPKSATIALIKRNGKFLTASGPTILEANDVILVLSDTDDGLKQVHECLHLPFNEED
ncbi:MAG: TrkA C-terminal domain-containing protein, partial [Cyclobacteriaceae bacterium]